MAEHRLPKPRVEGSNPFSRSIKLLLYYLKEGDRMSNHIKTIVKPNLKSDKDTNCRECQASCQSACKTSCTVGNQVCNK